MKLKPMSILSSISGLVLRCKPIHAVFILGLAVRIWSAAFRTIINPDGAQYIFQASALLNHDWSSLLSCKLSYLSPLPFMIAAAFAVCRDWIVAGQLVNVLFGWATLLPLYHILRRFFDSTTCTLTVLCYALMPVLVEGSGNVIRDPMFWYCACMGMLFFIRQWDGEAQTGRFRYDLVASMLLFLLATWCRIEGVVFLAAPFVYLVFARTDRKIQRCCLFAMPILLVAMTVLTIAMTTGIDIHTALRLNQVTHEATRFAYNYQALETWIENMSTHQGGIYPEFLRRTGEILGLIPLVVIFQNILEGVFYPFALIFFGGMFAVRHFIRQHRRLAFFVWQAMASLVVLYVHTLQTWIVAYRFLAVIILPGCVLMAAGVGRSVQYLQSRHHLSTAKALACMAAALIIIALPKNLKPEESDKAVYRQAARTMIQQGFSDASANIAGVSRSRALDWIFLYSHRKSTSLACSVDMSAAVSSDYRQFVANLDQAGIRFLLYEERFWPHDVLDLPAAPHQNDFRLLGQWQHPDSKRFMLFKRSGT